MAGQRQAQLVPITREVLRAFYKRWPLEAVPKHSAQALMTELDRCSVALAEAGSNVQQQVSMPTPTRLDDCFWRSRQYCEEVAHSLQQACAHVPQDVQAQLIQLRQLLLATEQVVLGVQHDNTNAAAGQIKQFLPQDFRGALLESRRTTQEGRNQRAVDALLKRGGSIRAKYELFLQQQWERREALVQMGNLSGMFKLMVRYIGGVPQVLLDFAKEINAKLGPMEEQRIKYGPDFYLIIDVGNSLNVMAAQWAAASPDRMPADKVLAVLQPAVEFYCEHLQRVTRFLGALFVKSPFFVTAEDVAKAAEKVTVHDSSLSGVVAVNDHDVPTVDASMHGSSPQPACADALLAAVGLQAHHTHHASGHERHSLQGSIREHSILVRVSLEQIKHSVQNLVTHMRAGSLTSHGSQGVQEAGLAGRTHSGTAATSQTHSITARQVSSSGTPSQGPMGMVPQAQVQAHVQTCVQAGNTAVSSVQAAAAAQPWQLSGHDSVPALQGPDILDQASTDWQHNPARQQAADMTMCGQTHHSVCPGRGPMLTRHSMPAANNGNAVHTAGLPSITGRLTCDRQELVPCASGALSGVFTSVACSEFHSCLDNTSWVSGVAYQTSVLADVEGWTESRQSLHPPVEVPRSVTLDNTPCSHSTQQAAAQHAAATNASPAARATASCGGQDPGHSCFLHMRPCTPVLASATAHLSSNAATGADLGDVPQLPLIRSHTGARSLGSIGHATEGHLTSLGAAAALGVARPGSEQQADSRRHPDRHHEDASHLEDTSTGVAPQEPTGITLASSSYSSYPVPHQTLSQGEGSASDSAAGMPGAVYTADGDGSSHGGLQRWGVAALASDMGTVGSARQADTASMGLTSVMEEDQLSHVALGQTRHPSALSNVGAYSVSSAAAHVVSESRRERMLTPTKRTALGCLRCFGSG